MQKIYRSKVELLVLIPLLAISAAAIYFLSIQQNWIGAGGAFLFLCFLLYLCINTKYEVTDDDRLRIRSGIFYRKEIHIRSIKRIRSTKNILASPALSS